MERKDYQPTIFSQENGTTCCSSSVVCGNEKKTQSLLQFYKAIGFFVFMLMFGIAPVTEVKACYPDQWAGWANNGSPNAGVYTPTCSNQSFAPPSRGYTYMNLRPGVSYTFSASPGTGWTTPRVEAYYYNCSGWVCITGANSSITFTAPNSCGDYHYLAVVRNGNSANPAWPGTSATLTYRQNTTISNTTSTAAMCQGQTRTTTASLGGTHSSPAITYEESGPGSVSGTLFTAGGNGTSTITARVGNHGGTGPVGGCSSSINIVTYSTTVGGTVSPASQTICTNQGFVPTQHTLSGHTGSVVRWEYATPTSGWNAWAGTSTTAPSNCCFTDVGTWQVRALVQNGACSQVYSSVASIIVQPDPGVSASGDATICDGGSVTLSSSVSGGTGSCTRQWQYYNGSSWVNLGTAATQSTGALSATRQFRVLYSCTGSNCDQAVSNTVTVTVNADPSASISAVSPTLCYNGSTTLNSSVSGGTGALSYQWQYSTAGAGGPWTNAGTGSSQATGTLTASRWYQLLYSASGTGCNTFTSNIVKVTVDETPPTITCPSNISGNTDANLCTRLVTYATPTVSDNCPGLGSATLTGGLASGSPFPKGPTIVSWSVQDAKGNVSNCSFTVSVTDAQSPSITCPANINKGNDLNSCGSVTTYSIPYSDNCPGATLAMLGGLSSGSSFPVGSTTVTYRATDAVGNSTSCSFSVTVNDVQPPAITCPANITQGADGDECGGTVNYTISTSDNCTASPTLTLLSGLGSSSLFPVGTTTVTWRARDAALNSSTCSFTVTVTENVPPVITCPSNISVFNASGVCGAPVTYSTPSATDNCIAVSVGQLSGLSSGSTFPVGVTTNVWRATDLQGNSASCSFTVTVVDNRPPQALCQSATAILSGSGSASITAANVNNGSNDECGVASLSVAPSTFGCSNIGANTVTLTVTDVNGNVATCNTTVTVVDNIAPVAVCKPITIQLNAAGSASITAAQINNGSSDICGISLSALPTSFGCSNVGNNTVILTVTDPSGNATTCSSVVTVQDVTAPNANCQNITVQLNAAGTASITASQVNNGSNDACGVTLSASPTTFGCANTGANTVVLTVKDPSLNTSTCNATVTVQDNVDPVALCKNITIDLNAAGSASITGSSVDNGSNDACGIASLSVAPNSFSCANVGGNAVVLTVTDTKGNVSTCGATVTVRDVTLPNAICQTVTVSLNAAGNGSITAAQVNNGSNDACGIQSLATFPLSFNCTHVGTQQTVLTVTDNNGNQNTCVGSVIVQDLVPPVALCQDYTLELDFAGYGSVIPDTIDNGSNDACGVASLDLTGTSSIGNYTNASAVLYNCNDVATSPHAVTLTVTDVNGNTTTCTASVTVIDNIPPVVECYNVTKNNDFGVCQAFVTVPAIDILDNCLALSGITSVTNTYTGSNDASGTYPVGLTSVTWTVSDAFNNTSTCTFTVNVIDNEAPTYDNPTNTFTITNPGLCYGSIIIPTLYNVNDNCGVASVVNSWTGTNNASGNYPEGITVVLWSVTDIHGNVTQKPQFIAVIDFENPAVVPGTCPGPVTVGTDAGLCEAEVALSAPSYTDNCGIGLVFATVNNVVINGVSDDFPIGTTTVVWKAQDINGNYNQTCSQTITVVDDDAPAITCPASIVKNSDLNACSAVTAVSAPATSDNCGVQSVTNDFTGTSSASGTYPVGSTEVTYTVTDVHGNTTTCNFTVTVNDSQEPSITCPADVTQASDAGVCEAAVSIGAAVASDNCGVDLVINDYTGSEDASATYPVGTTTVTWIVIDVNGNLSQCEQDITINDTEMPSITCADNQSQSVDAGECGAAVAVVGPATGDNCAVDLVINDYTGSEDASEIYPVGTTTVTWIVLDVNGNLSQCEQYITVNDDEVPSITCAPAQTHSVDAGVCEANVTVVSPVASDNCGVDLVINDYTGSDDGSSVYPVGTTTLTWIVLDIYGNIEFCSQDITVVDDENPTIACAPAQTQTADAGECQAAVAVAQPATGDNCGVADVTNDYNGSPDASDVYPVGTTTITWMVTDIYGNTAQCTQDITVTDDEFPIIVCDDSQTQTADAGVCDAAVIVGSPVSTGDNCGVASVLNDYNGTSDASDTYPVGLTTITWTITDIHGNSAQCTQSITITDDEQPAITCAPDQTRDTDAGVCNAFVVVASPANSDNCGVAGYTNDYNGTSSAADTYPVGTTVITWTVTDIHGSSNQCVQNIKIEDNEAPAISCAPNQTQTADAGECNADVIVVGPTTGDNCGVASVLNDRNSNSDASGNYPVGTTTLTWTVVDVHGNSSQCTQTITITDDEAPGITCPADIAVNTNPGVCVASVSVPVPATSDNCAVAGLINDFSGTENASGTYNLGPTVVTWTVTDIHANTSICSITVTVTDVELPTITCPPNNTKDNTFGQCATSVINPLPVTGDNCGVAGYTNDYNGTSGSSDVYPVGATTVIYTIADVNGNTNTCSFTVTVIDAQFPELACPANIAQTADPGVCEAYIIIPEPFTSDNCGISSITNSYTNMSEVIANFPIGFPVGTTSMVWSVTDVNGNTTSCTQTVTITDDEDPIVACGSDQTQITDPGVCEATVAVIAPVVSDNCGVASVVNDYNGTSDASGVYPFGTTTIEWTVTDIHGHVVTCLQDITIWDDERPVVTCPADIIQSADITRCDATVVVPAPVYSDNCGIMEVVNDYTWTSNASAVYPVGTTTVMFGVADLSDNWKSCTFTVTITDNEAPVVTCPANITLNSEPGICEASVTVALPVNSDNCGVASIVNDYTANSDASGVYPVGATTVTYTVADIYGNTTTCTVVVTVNDEELPSITCPSDISQDTDLGECEADVSVAIPATGDNCAVLSVVNSYNSTNDATDVYFVGTTDVTYTVTDIHGNSTSCSFTVTITDNEAPEVTCPANITQTADAGECEAFVVVPVPTFSDNCGVVMLLNDYTMVPDVGADADYPVGTTHIIYGVTDANDNWSICDVFITVTDDEAPTITCPADQVVSADAGVCTAAILIAVPGTDDNCGVASIANDFNGSNNASDTYPLGTTTVTFTVTDVHTNTTTCSFTVTVNDQEVPTITCPADIIQTADAGVCTAVVTVPAPPAFADNCAVASVLNNYNGTADASDTYVVGVTIVEWTVTDPSGNSADCAMSILVTDNEDPTITCPADITQTADAGQCNANVTVPAPVTADNCAVAGWTNGYNGTADASDNYPVGTTSVGFTVIDESGNYSTCSFTITVTDDEAPVITCVDQTQTADPTVCEAYVTVGAQPTSDNCGVSGTLNDRYNSNNGSGIYPVGTTQVVWTVTDIYGNSSSCTQNITVTDDEVPVSICQDVTIQLSATTNAGSASITTSDINNGSTDNCGIDGYALDETDFDCSEVGANTVVLTVTDIHGNFSTCSATVTVEDNVAPIALCQDVTIQLSAGTNNGDGAASITTADINNGSSDNCGVASLALDEEDFDCSEVGANTVVLTVTDVNGNTTTCSATVTVEDNVAPDARCQDVTIQLDAGTSPAGTTGGGAASITTGDIDNNSTDNCTIASLVLDETDFDCSEVGANTVVLTVTDVNGNVSTCSATVTVEDNVAPDARCQDITINLPLTGTVGIVPADIDNNSTDNCAIASLSVAPNTFLCTDQGPNTVVLTVTDVNGNVSTCSATVTVTTDPLVITELSSPTFNCGYNISCNGNTDGSVALEVIGGCLPYSYNWSNGATTEDLSGLAAGTYDVTITDANGDDITGSITLTQPDLLAGTGVLSEYVCGYNVSCNGANDGSIDLTVVGGCAPYTYTWTTIGGSGLTAGQEDQSGLTRGIYRVLIKDQNNCSKLVSFQLTEPDALTVTDLSSQTPYVGSGNISCNGANDGSINLDIDGGAECEPYTYAWSGPDIIVSTTNTVTTTATISGKVIASSSGSYGSSSSDSKKSSSKWDSKNKNGGGDNCNISYSSRVEGNPDNNGAIFYSIGDHCVFELEHELPAGQVYTIKWRQKPYQSGTSSMKVLESADGVLFGANTGSPANTTNETYFSQNFTTGATTRYIWLEAAASPDFEVDAITYTFTETATTTTTSTFTYDTTITPVVTSGNGVSVTSNSGVVNPNNALGAANGVGAELYDNGDQFIVKLGHVVPVGTSYTITWRQKPGQSGTSYMYVYESLAGSSFGSGTQVSTTNESFFNQTFVAGTSLQYVKIYDNSSSDFQVDAISYTLPTTYDTVITATPIPTIPFTASTEDLSGLAAGTYCVTVTDANGCSLDTCITLTQPEPIVTGICNNQTVLFGYYPENVAQITTNVTGGTEDYSYLWNTGETTASITVAPTTTTTYSVTVTDQNGCVAVGSSTVSVVDVRCGSGLDRISMCDLSNKNQCVKISDVPAKLTAGWKLGGCGGGSQEALCSNGIDDDGNGLADCLDPACWITNACGGVNPDLSNGDCGAPTIGGCACTGGIKSYSVQYNGTSGATVKAYSGTGHTGLLATFTGVANGQLLTVNAASGTLGTYTYFEVVGGGADIAVYTGCGSYTISGDADQVTSQTSVSNANNALGSPNSNGAVLNDATDVFVLRLEDELPAGKTYKIYWKKSGSGTASMTVSESANNSTFTQNGAAITTTSTSWTSVTITAGVATKYVKIQSGSSVDFHIDAVTYSYSITQGVGLVSDVFTTAAYTDARNSTCSGNVTTCNICSPSGYVKLMAVKYYGPSNATVRVRDYPGQHVFQTFYGVQNGDELVVNGTFNGGNLDYITYLEIVGQSGPYASIPTDCNNGAGGDLIGRTYGSFKVTGLTDNKNNACGMDAPCDCDGGISYIGLIYDGPAGGTVSAYAKSGHQSALGIYGPLNPGDTIIFRSDAADLYKFNNNTYFEIEGYTPDIVIPTSCGTYLENVQFGTALTVFGWIDKEGNLCNMDEQPICPCYNGVKEITIEYDLYDSLTLSDATVLFYADALHSDTIAVFEDVDVGDVMTVWAGDLAGGIFPNITYVQITAPPFITISGNAASVVTSSGVSSATNTIGAPNGSGTLFSNTGNNVVLDLGTTLPAGTSYQIYWRRSNGSTASMTVLESADGVTFTQNGGTVTTSSSSYVTATLTAAANTKFLKIVSASSTDFYVDAVAYTYTVTQTSVARPDIKFKTSCSGLEDLVGESVRELFVEGIIDGDGNICDNSCGIGKTLMCHYPHSHGHSWSSNSSSSSHGSRWHHHNHNHNHHGSGNWGQASNPQHTHCVKNKDVTKKLQSGDWTLGPCPATAKPEALVVGGEEGFLLTAAPNPFNESTTIRFRMTGEERVSVTVYNVAGEEMARLFEGVAEKDKLYQVEFHSEMNPDGMYFFRLVTESGDVYIRKLIQTKQ